MLCEEFIYEVLYTTVNSILHPNILHSFILVNHQPLSCKGNMIWVCLCLDLYCNTHMLAEGLILQGGLALQSYVWFITGTNVNIAIYFKYMLSMMYLKLYIYIGMPIWHSFHKVVKIVLEYHSTIIRFCSCIYWQIYYWATSSYADSDVRMEVNTTAEQTTLWWSVTLKWHVDAVDFNCTLWFILVC